MNHLVSYPDRAGRSPDAGPCAGAPRRGRSTPPRRRPPAARTPSSPTVTKVPRATPAGTPASGRSATVTGAGPTPPTLATQLNNGDIAGQAAARRPQLPLTPSAGPSGGGPARSGLRGAAGPGHEAPRGGGGGNGGGLLPLVTARRRSRPRAARPRKEVGGESGEGSGGRGAADPAPPRPPPRSPRGGKLGPAGVAPLGTPRLRAGIGGRVVNPEGLGTRLSRPSGSVWPNFEKTRNSSQRRFVMASGSGI